MPEFSGIDIVRYLDNNGKLRDNTILFLTAATILDFELQKGVEKGVKICLKNQWNLTFSLST
jgi:hypothetical protein